MLLFCVVVFVDRQQSGHRSWQLFEVRQGRTRRTSTFFRSISAIDSGILLLLFMFTVGCCGFREVLKPQSLSSQFVATAGSPYQLIKTLLNLTLIFLAVERWLLHGRHWPRHTDTLLYVHQEISGPQNGQYNISIETVVWCGVATTEECL